jgi:serine protease AprX
MRKIILLFSLLIISTILSSQSSNTRYWVAFKDKIGSPYTVGNPSQFLSARAIARRTLHSYPVTTEDLPVNPSYIAQVKATGAVLISTTRWYNGIVVRITNPSQVTAINALACVQSSKSVARIKPLPTTVNNGLNTSVSEKGFAPQNINRFNYGTAYGQIHQLNGECLHNQYYDGKGMQIAEIDDGFNNANTISVFDSLWMQNRVIGKHNFFSGDTTDLFSIGGHGTSVLSCMSAFTPGSMIGTAPYAKYYLLRSEVDSSEQIMEEYSWVSAIEYADSAGADVATSSLGYTAFNDATQSHTWADLNGRNSVASLSATMAARRGLIVCVAAGNEGSNAWQKISIPSDADSILTVGAVNSGGAYASFSSVGYSADGRVKPDVMAWGQNSTVVSSNSGNVITSSGTSFATPILAGMVACLWQGNPTKTNMQVITAIKQSATQYLAPDSLMGYGIPDFCLADNILKGNVGTQVYVSPTFGADQSSVIITGSNSLNLTIEMYDVSGRLLASIPAKVLKDNGYKQAIEIPNSANLPTGMYLVKITSDDGRRWVTKLIK